MKPYLTLSAGPVIDQETDRTAAEADTLAQLDDLGIGFADWCSCDCGPCNRRRRHAVHAPLVVSAVVARIHDPLVASVTARIADVRAAWPESELRFAWGDR